MDPADDETSSFAVAAVGELLPLTTSIEQTPRRQRAALRSLPSSSTASFVLSINTGQWVTSFPPSNLLKERRKTEEHWAQPLAVTSLEERNPRSSLAPQEGTALQGQGWWRLEQLGPAWDTLCSGCWQQGAATGHRAPTAPQFWPVPASPPGEIEREGLAPS